MSANLPGWMDKQKWMVIHWDINPEERHVEGINTIIEHFSRMGVDVADRIATKAIVAEIEYGRHDDCRDKSKGKWFGDQVQMQVVLTEDEHKIVKEFCKYSLRPKDIGIHHTDVLGDYYMTYLSNDRGLSRHFGEKGKMNEWLNNSMSDCHSVHLSCKILQEGKDARIV